MHQGRRWDRHLRRDTRVGFQETEVLDHRMTREADSADDVRPLRLGLHAGELDTVRDLLHLDAVESAEEIEVPPGAPELAIRGELQAAFLLLGDDLPDLGIFDRLELIGRDRAFLAPAPRVLDRGCAQKAADMIGAEGWFGTLHMLSLVSRTRRSAERCAAD